MKVKNLILLICLFFGIFLITENLFAQVASIIEMKGKVEILKVNVWKSASVGTVLYGSEKIRTGKNSKCVLLFKQGNQLTVTSNTTFDLSDVTEKTAVIKLSRGKVRFQIKKFLKTARYEIRTPVGVCAVRGTDFSVEYENEIMRVEVYEGVVLAREETTKSEVLIHPGEFSQIERGTAPIKPEKIKEESIITPEKEKPVDEITISAEQQREIFNEISREEVMARVAEEIKAAEYYEGKTAIDASGRRVRMEAYVVRNIQGMTPEQFKYVNLNNREDRFDFGKILFSFDKALPENLYEATKNMLVSYETPKYILKELESIMSNQTDKIIEVATDGTMVNNDGKWVHEFNNYKLYVGDKDSTENDGKGRLMYEIRNNDFSTLYGDLNNDGVSDAIIYNPLDGTGNDILKIDEINYPKGKDLCDEVMKNTFNHPSYNNFNWTLEKILIDNNGIIQPKSPDESLNSALLNLGQKVFDMNIELIYKSDFFKDESKTIDLMVSGIYYKWFGLIK